jgi:hypothetical protein
VVLEHATMTEFCGIPLTSLRENSITELNLWRKGVGVPGAIVLSKLLPSVAALTSLKCACRPKVFAFLSAPIDTPPLSPSPPHPSLDSLYESCIGDKGASALVAILKETQITNLGCAAAPECLLLCQCPLTLCAAFTASRLRGTSIGGYYNDDGEFVFNTDGIIALCEGLKGSAVTSLECAAASKCLPFCQRPLTPHLPCWQSC